MVKENQRNKKISHRRNKDCPMNAAKDKVHAGLTLKKSHNQVISIICINLEKEGKYHTSISGEIKFY